VGAGFQSWLDRFFATYYRHRPVNATFIGNHDHDHRLPELSDEGVSALSSDADALGVELQALSGEELSLVEELDSQLARGFLEIQKWELDSGHFHRLNPATYTGEAIFGVVSLLLRDFAPLAERLESARARLAAVPRLLDEGRRNVASAPRAWSERALRECAGAHALLDDDLLHVPGAGKLEDEASLARSAFDRYQEHVARLPDSPRYGCGEEAFELLLRRGHFLDWSALEIAERAHEALRRSKEELEAGARRLGFDGWEGARARLEEIHPSRDDYYGRFGKLRDESRRLASERGLLTWPDYPLDFVPQPAWARKAAPLLYFLFYRSPAPLDAATRVDYLVPPIDPELAEEEAELRLRATNESVIKLNHVVHHGGIGHHVQNWHAFRASSRIGRVAAVDCASRIAFFCGGTMAEGWASYATDLMDEAGFLAPIESLAEENTRERMAARAIVDVKLHHGEMSFDDAERFYRERARMTESAARAEVTKNGMFPGAALVYFVGSSLIHELRRETSARLGERFDLRRFHDELLAHGSIPVSMIARSMSARSRA
jgi:hypothetical protein